MDLFIYWGMGQDEIARMFRMIKKLSISFDQMKDILNDTQLPEVFSIYLFDIWKKQCKWSHIDHFKKITKFFQTNPKQSLRDEDVKIESK